MMRSFKNSHKITKSRSAKNKEKTMSEPVKKSPINTDTSNVKITSKIDRVELVNKARLSNIAKSKMIRSERRNHINLTNRFVDPQENTFFEDSPWFDEEYKFQNDDFTRFPDGYDDFPEVNYMEFGEIPV